MRLQTQWLSRVSGLLTLITTVLFIPATNSFAQASLFDPAFKVGSGANGPVYSIVVQDDGKIIAGGAFTQIAGQSRTNLARLNSDGTLDETFPQGTDGAVYRLLRQTDGRVLVAGAFTELQGAYRRGVGRILANGNVDPEFNAGSVLGDHDAFFSLAVQPDDKVLVATLGAFFPNSISTLFRLQANGQPDSSFIQTNSFSLNQPWAILPLTNGSILLGGGFQNVNGIPSPGMVVLSTNGERDFSFVSPFDTNSGNYSGVYSIVPLPNEGFLIGGRFWKQGSSNRLTVAKLNSTLAWDATFQPDSFDSQFDSPLIGTVMSALRQPNGKFVLGGPFEEVGGYWRRGIVRLDSDGRVDPCFDPGMGLSSSTLVAEITSLALHGNGQVLVAGNFINLMASSHNITRLLPQSECNAIRVHFGGNLNSAFTSVAGTCTPGGTNHLEWSTNLVDWETAKSSASPYVYSDVSSESFPALFFRVRKEY